GVVGSFLEEFAREGRFEGSIVVGSPYNHGPFNTTARDSPYAVELGFFLGRLFAPPNGLVVRLDTEVKALGPGKEDMILVGGPVANIITMDLNPHLAVNFDWKQVWRMESSRTRRPYADEQVGLIAKVRNPWNPDRVIVLLSGLHAVGTMAAILGLTRFADDVLDGFTPGEDFYRVVAGQDRDGDGRLDAVSSSNDSTERRALVRDLVLEPSVRGLDCSDGLGHPVLGEQEEDAHTSLRSLDDRGEHAELDPRSQAELFCGNEARDIEGGDDELFRRRR